MAMRRRDFIQTSLGAAAAMTLAGTSRAADAKDIRIAVIGFKGRGQSHIGALGDNIVALCDVDERVLGQQVDKMKKDGKKVDAFTDYRKLLERDDIDAVTIATPNHTHALITVAAAQAGKDVYCEKPVSQTMWEGRQSAAAAERYGRVIQTGTQSRSNRAVQEAVEFVRSGELGPIEHVTATCYKARPSIGKLDSPLVIPTSLDYELWCGPAEKRDLYRKQVHYDWHWDFNTGSGDLGNQGIHQMDIARWFLGENALAPRVFSIGGRLGYDDAGDTPNTQIVYHDYEKAPLIFEVRGLPISSAFQKNGRWENDVMDHYRGSGIGVVVQCKKGHVVSPSNYSNATAYDLQGNVVKDFRGGGNHFDNWLQAVASRDAKSLNAPILDGHLSSALCHAGNVSYLLGDQANAAEAAERVRGSSLMSSAYERMAGHLRANGVDIDREPALTVGKWLELDPSTETFTGEHSDAANKLAKREDRKPFVVPDIEGQLTTASLNR